MLHELKTLFSVLALTSQFSVHIRNPDNKKNPPTQKYFPPTCTLFAVLPIVGSGILLASGGLTAYSKACRGKWNIFLELALEQTMIDAQPTQTLMHMYPHKSNWSVGDDMKMIISSLLGVRGPVRAQAGLCWTNRRGITKTRRKNLAFGSQIQVRIVSGWWKSLKSM